MKTASSKSSNPTSVQALQMYRRFYWQHTIKQHLTLRHCSDNSRIKGVNVASEVGNGAGGEDEEVLCNGWVGIDSRGRCHDERVVQRASITTLAVMRGVQTACIVKV